MLDRVNHNQYNPVLDNRWNKIQDKRGSMVAVSDHMVAMSDHIYGIQVCINNKKELENKRANTDLASLSERKDRNQ